jgi:hypothetical protein
MSRLTGTDAYGLMEAYNNVYTPQELTEEQVWEEVEIWVNSLIEEGYDLSDYTWEEMYESYIEEMGRAMTTGQMTAPKVAPTPRQARLNMEMEYDTYDTVLEHLVSEGYADTEESALVIMANMSEEWREEILDEARVDDGKSKEDKRKIRTARAGRSGVNLPNSSLHTGDIDRRDAHRTTDDLNKDARDIRRGKLNLPQFQGTTGRERVAQVKKEKGIR